MEGINSIFNHGFMSFASVCIIVACLIIMGSFTLLALKVEQMIHTMEDQNQILVYIDDRLSDDQARALETSIEAIPNITNAVFVHRDDAMESFVAAFEDTSLFDGLDSSVLRHSFVIYMEDIAQMEATRNQLAVTPGIANINAHTEISEGFVKIRSVVSAVSMVLVGVLPVISLFIMSNTINSISYSLLVHNISHIKVCINTESIINNAL